MDIKSLQFIKKANQIHSNKFDYKYCVITNSRDKICIICPIHGQFWQRADSHLQGNGCSNCARFIKNKSNTDDFIQKSINVHKYLYSYELVRYVSCDTDVEIICNIHGSFNQIPSNHLSGHGCPKCGDITGSIKNSSTNEEFILKANSIHNYRYDYSLSEYKHNNSTVIIICSIHDKFLQKPRVHLAGSGCPECAHELRSHNFISKSETCWLDSLNINLERQKVISVMDKTYIVDGFNPITNTVYEFYGDYWHGNPTKYVAENINIHNGYSFKELYQRTMLREVNIKSKYNFISIWETEWLATLV